MPKPQVEEIDGITVEYVLAPKMVVFSHGFGVRRDTSGFFTEIAKNLPAGFGYVLFDYYEYDKRSNTVTLTDFTQQVKKLNRVLEWTRQQGGTKRVSIIAHSIGSVVTALAKPDDVAEVVMLAPPTSIGENTRNYFTNKQGAEKKDDFWFVPRSDGTTSKIPSTMFDEFESTDAIKEIIAYGNEHPLTVITAAEDEVLQDVDYEKLVVDSNIHIVAVEGADHNFTGDARSKVIQLIRENL